MATFMRRTLDWRTAATAHQDGESTAASPVQAGDDPFAEWNSLLEPQPWWRESAPYVCFSPPKTTSPWIQAGMADPGGSDPLSLIRYFGNGSYLRYGYMGFAGCTPMKKYPDRTHLDPPADPSYYSLGQLDITVDIVRVPPDAPGWFEDDGSRESMSMAEAVTTLNRHVATYYNNISEGNLTLRFHAGVDFALGGAGSPEDVEAEHMHATGLRDCRDEAAASQQCSLGALGGLNRLLLTDVTSDTGGFAYNGSAQLGLVSLRIANMEALVHEIGHGWMNWPHSYAEVRWRPYRNENTLDLPNPYSNSLDFMSGLTLYPVLGWRQDMPSTMAINRYAAGWIQPDQVALHLSEDATYTLRPPRQGSYQLLVISSGRPHAFTTLEVLDRRNVAYTDETPTVFDPIYAGGRRPYRYQGVLVSRYDQTTGTGTSTRLGPALYNQANPDHEHDVGWGRDDHSVIPDGQSRDIGGGIRVDVSLNRDGSYQVRVAGGRIAPFTPWCNPVWFSPAEYDTGCKLNTTQTPLEVRGSERSRRLLYRVMMVSV